MTIPVGFCQATWNFSGNGLQHPAAVVCGFDQGSGAAVEDVASSLYNLMGITILTKLTNDINLDSCVVKFGPDSTGPSAEATGSFTGGVSSPGASSQVAYLVRKNTGLGGRRGRGRMYLPGVNEAAIGSDGVLDSTFLGELQDEVDEFVGSLSLASLPMVVLHDDATAPTAVTTLVVQPVVATQRRRLRR